MKAMLLCAITLSLGMLATAGEALPDLKYHRAGSLVEITKVELVKVEADGIRVMHSAGMAKVPFEDLPAELVQRFGFDPVKAREHRKEQAAAAAQALADSVNKRATAPTAPPRSTSNASIKLWTKDEVKARWLAQCDPRSINPLDREIGSKRAEMVSRAEAIRGGKMDIYAESAARHANAKALAAAGDADGAAREADAAQRADSLMRQMADRERLNNLYYSLINGAPPLRSVGGG